MSPDVYAQGGMYLKVELLRCMVGNIQYYSKMILATFKYAVQCY